jgi:hypothetical protein
LDWINKTAAEAILPLLCHHHHKFTIKLYLGTYLLYRLYYYFKLDNTELGTTRRGDLSHVN